MATRELAVSDLLCFALFKYSRLSSDELKAILLDFYEPAIIARAKSILLDGIKDFKAELKLPHMPAARRDIAGEVNDIVIIISAVDENQLYHKLPKYVCETPDSMPSSRICEGDLKCLMSSIRKMGEKVDTLRTEVAAMMKVVNDVQVRCSAPAAPPLGHAGYTQQVSSSVGQTVTLSRSLQPPASLLQPLQATPGNSRIREPAKSTGSCLLPGANWADMTTSSPIPVSNRFSSLPMSDDQGIDVDDQGAFGDVSMNAKPKRGAKRLRQSPSIQQQVQQQLQEQSQQPSLQRRSRRSGRLLTGRSMSSTGARLTAAKTFVDKAVFCVDNVNTSVTAGDIWHHVQKLSVTVISCFPTKPRRRRGESEPITDRNAFRLCIVDEDKEKLLNADSWPNSVTIFEWFRGKPRGSGTQAQLRPQPVHDNISQAEATVAATVHKSPPAAMDTVAPATENEADDEDEIETIHDSTIVVIDSAAVNSDSATLIDNGDE